MTLQAVVKPCRNGRMILKGVDPHEKVGKALLFAST